MITKWYYDIGDAGQGRREVLETLQENNYNTIDVGAGVLYWSYPHCLTVADYLPDSTYNYGDSKVKAFQLNLNDESSWNELLDYVDVNGKYDYSICSHTLEDIHNPIGVIKLLQQISKRGFIATPSKHIELSQMQEAFRGYVHHKYIFNIGPDNCLYVLPKQNFIENSKVSDEISSEMGGKQQLCVFWEDEINYKLFGINPFFLDKDYLDEYYNMLKYEAQN